MWSKDFLPLLKSSPSKKLNPNLSQPHPQLLPNPLHVCHRCSSSDAAPTSRRPPPLGDLHLSTTSISLLHLSRHRIRSTQCFGSK
ncbi:hypothetical protein HanPSC8_Chr10g0436601 [Helianthus annuus]|nr:hypothetical protein HanPSC8_Chr10g0436601 [Helianthus annuus]